MPAAVDSLASARNPAGLLERADELGDGGAGDAGAAGEVGRGDGLGGDGAQGQELRECQRWRVGREQALDPAADVRRDAYEGVDGIGCPTGARHS